MPNVRKICATPLSASLHVMRISLSWCHWKWSFRRGPTNMRYRRRHIIEIGLLVAFTQRSYPEVGTTGANWMSARP